MAQPMTEPGAWRVRHLLPVVLALGAGAVAFRLGIWQLDRADQKHALAQVRATARAAEPIALSRLEANALLEARGRHVVITVDHARLSDAVPVPTTGGHAAATASPAGDPSPGLPQAAAAAASPRLRQAAAASTGLPPAAAASAETFPAGRKVPDADPQKPGPATWYVDNRSYKGAPGIHVLAVLPLVPDPVAARAEQLVPASDAPHYVLLLRGWQAKDPRWPQGIAPGGKISDGQQLIARVESAEEHRSASVALSRGVAGDAPWHWLGIDPVEMGRVTGARIVPVVLRQIDTVNPGKTSDTPIATSPSDANFPGSAVKASQTSITSGQDRKAEDGLVRDWAEPSAGIDKHKAYAFQWFSLAFLAAALALGLAWRAWRAWRAGRSWRSAAGL